MASPSFAAYYSGSTAVATKLSDNIYIAYIIHRISIYQYSKLYENPDIKRYLLGTLVLTPRVVSQVQKIATEIGNPRR